MANNSRYENAEIVFFIPFLKSFVDVANIMCGALRKIESSPASL